MKTLYDVLGVPKDASQDDIRAAYKQKRSEHHPDREGGDHDLMAELNAAYDVLGNTESRAVYDAVGHSDVQEFERTVVLLMSSAIEQSLDGLPVGVIKRATTLLYSRILALKVREDSLRKEIKRTEALSGGTKTADEVNLVEKILKERMELQRAAMKEATSAIWHLAEAHKRMGRYEDVMPPEAPTEKAHKQGYRIGLDFGTTRTWSP